ncbi:heavy metal translocating P-type ATPase [Shewanella litorisediminis]|uniref:Copper-exporting P-type ATPase n=1 Tax=Shewanella litorisediminis TaxID=1173586 RepID=A0ABX7G8Q5_9GAMM|nr:heavy metal translocating P-type ATPase [Shewanella litorisediminis]MCL2916722.1 heavy metal translocating P-type ATPase [Shewanella litorisediminis]QRH03597.1 copper-translocating P-type ATPase [Shewanella litorisediminis]
MSCASCVTKIEGALRSAGGQGRVDLSRKVVRVKGLSADKALAALSGVGYPGELLTSQQKSAVDDGHQFRTRLWQAAVGLGLGIPMMLWGLLGGDMMVNEATRFGWGLMGAVTGLAMFFTGSHFYVGLWRSLKAKSATMDTLIALGTGTAWLYSMALVLVPEVFPPGSRHVYFEASVMILGLINLGHALEARARGKTSEALDKLLGLKIDEALRLEDGTERWVSVADIVVDDLIRVRPGDRIALDSKVIEGESLVDESMLSGEPLPVAKAPGEQVYAGTVNGNGSLVIKVTAEADESRLSQIIALVEEAQTSKLPIGRLTDAISAVFVPVVVAIALLAALIWYWIGPEPALSHAMVVLTTVLIIACPCALGLATPMSIMVGVGRAAAMGILVKNGEALERASKVTTVVLDKTGTLTLGKPEVRKTLWLAGDEVITRQAIASLERQSSHPLSDALAALSDAPSLAVSEFQNLPGEGLMGKVTTQDGTHEWHIGNPRLIARLGEGTAAELDVESELSALARDALTPVLVAKNGELVALLGVGDPLRADAKAAMARLKAQGKRLVLLSGDNQHTAEAVCRAVGIEEVIAGVMPDEKHQHVAHLKASGEVVAMVGDGINDAPALAEADVGIAMGTGTDVAIESASLTLLSPRLEALADAFALSKATLGNIRQNLFGAFIYNVLGIPVAAGVLYPAFGILLSPVLAGAAMAASSLTVVTNANRLKSKTLKDE